LELHLWHRRKERILRHAPPKKAVFVAETLGNRLQYFQIGNEADLFDRHLRDPKTWSAKTYLEK
jgi:hypothetical protein